MVVTAKCGRVAICEAIQPSVPDLGCGFQSHFSAGTRSRALRVFAPPWSHSVTSSSLIGIFLAPGEMSENEVDCTGTQERQANLRPCSARKMMYRPPTPGCFGKRVPKVLKTRVAVAKSGKWFTNC